MTKLKNKVKKTPRDKYTLGAFVEGNRQISQQYQNQINSLATPQGGQLGSQTMSGVTSGAAIGTSIAPGIGTAIGGLIGGVGGLIFGGIRDRKEREAYRDQINQLNTARSNMTKDLYTSSIDMNNENPYGVYKNGGDILNPAINIEKGELQINPETGKILREFNGINPETGGLYEKHAKGSKKDSKNNMVTAEEGTFIITKKEAKNYKDAVDNNDKLYQNSIMQNIRNYKKDFSKKYANGSDVLDPNLLYSMPLAGVNPTGNLNIPTSLPNTSFRSIPQANISNGAGTGLNISNIASTALNYLPSIYNMVQGSKRANTMPYTPVRMNVANRQRILSNLPQDVSANPALNNIRNARNRAYRGVNMNTANPAIARANRLSLEGNFLDAENQATYNSQLANNQIRGQRASILSGLEGQDQARSAQNVQNLNQTLLTNRQMQLAKEQQFNTGLSQAQQMFQNNRRNRQLGNMDQQTLELLKQVFPNAGNLFDPWKGGNG